MNSVFILLISGDRNGTNSDFYNKIKNDLLRLKKKYSIVIVLHGGAKGIDSITENICRELDIETKVYYADWSKYGKSAGPIRNKLMI